MVYETSWDFIHFDLFLSNTAAIISSIDDPCLFDHVLIECVVDRHEGSFNIAHIKDSAGHNFATRLGNVFVIGNDQRPWVSLPKGKGIKLSILEERDVREAKTASRR